MGLQSCFGGDGDLTSLTAFVEVVLATVGFRRRARLIVGLAMNL